MFTRATFYIHELGFPALVAFQQWWWQVTFVPAFWMSAELRVMATVSDLEVCEKKLAYSEKKILPTWECEWDKWKFLVCRTFPFHYKGKHNYTNCSRKSGVNEIWFNKDSGLLSPAAPFPPSLIITKTLLMVLLLYEKEQVWSYVCVEWPTNTHMLIYPSVCCQMESVTAVFCMPLFQQRI